MPAKAKSKTLDGAEPKASKKQLSNELDRELADSFPASDPPTVTQPGVRLGAPDHKRPRRDR